MLSSRTTLLEKCLTLFYENFNQRYEYPIHVHYFDDIYSDDQISAIKHSISRDIYFHQVEYEIPPDIPEEELFFNRTNNNYVRRHFPPSRVGYLHMERFVSHLTAFGKKGCLAEALSDYECLMRIDDDSWFRKPILRDLFDSLEDNPFATAFTWNHVNQKVRDTREGLWDFYKSYLKQYGYTPKSTQLKEAVYQDNAELMHSLKWSAGNLNLYNIKKFIDFGWEEYQSELTRAAGDYRHRWGDIESIGLFAYTHFATGLKDLELEKQGLYSPRLPEALGNYAPSVIEQNQSNKKPSRLERLRKILPPIFGKARKQFYRMLA